MEKGRRGAESDRETPEALPPGIGIAVFFCPSQKPGPLDNLVCLVYNISIHLKKTKTISDDGEKAGDPPFRERPDGARPQAAPAGLALELPGRTPPTRMVGPAGFPAVIGMPGALAPVR